jgi:integral membrane protein (TIGR01906 family)
VAVFRAAATILFILSIPVALFTTNIRFVANEPRVYRYAIDQFDAVQTTGIDRGELIRAGGEIRDYFNNDEETLNIKVEDNGREVSLFNPRETAHMVEVNDLFRAVNKAQEFSLIYALSYVVVVVLWAREISMRALAVNVAIGCVASLAVIGVGVGVGIAGFDSAWEDFHQLLFSNDFWLLNPATDHLIQIFPPAFWESIVFFIGTMIAAEAAFLLLAAGIYIGASRHQASRALQTQYA